MVCTHCRRETSVGFFCHACDVYLADPSVGRRASLARRILAQMLDWVSAWVILLTILAFSGATGVTGSASAVLGTFFVAIMAWAAFSLSFLAKGRTPGKWLAGIRVTDKSGGSMPGLGRMLVRETIGKFASGFFLGLGYFWSIWDSAGQTWHDKIAGTLVVRQEATPVETAQSVASSSSPYSIAR